MAQYYENWQNGNVELGTGWKVQAGGFHIVRQADGRVGGSEINWLTGDNVASAGAAKLISTPLPPVVDFDVSMQWEWVFRHSTTAGNQRFAFYPFYDNEDLLLAAPNGNGYYVILDANGNFFLLRRIVAGVATSIINMGGSAPIDTDFHKLVVTREVSGANRNWRVYLDDVLIGGPANDAVVNTGNYMGIGLDENDMVSEVQVIS